MDQHVFALTKMYYMFDQNYLFRKFDQIFANVNIFRPLNIAVLSLRFVFGIPGNFYQLSDTILMAIPNGEIQRSPGFDVLLFSISTPLHECLEDFQMAQKGGKMAGCNAVLETGRIRQSAVVQSS